MLGLTLSVVRFMDFDKYIDMNLPMWYPIEEFHYLKNPCAPPAYPFLFLPNIWQPLNFLLSPYLAFLEYPRIVGIIRMWPFQICFFHLAICIYHPSMFSWLDSSFLFITEQHSLVQIYHNLFIHSPIEGHPACYQVLAVMNKASVNIHVQVFACVRKFSTHFGKYQECNCRVYGEYVQFCNRWPNRFPK